MECNTPLKKGEKNNMKNEFEQNNIAKVAGRVFTQPKSTHMIEGEAFYEFILEVKRLSSVYDYIPVTISERVLQGCPEIMQGDEIGILGEFRSYNKLENEKSKLILNVFARDVYLGDEVELLGESNSVKITGYICKQPVYRTTPFKREICDVLLAVNRRNGKSDYLPCIFWGRNAKFMEAQEIGVKVQIDGRIQSRVYTKKLEDGSSEERTAYEISVSTLKLCDLDDDDSASTKADAYREYLEQNTSNFSNKAMEK